MIFTIFIAALMISCGTEKHEVVRTSDDFVDLTSKAKTYLTLQEKLQDKYGWVESDDCDALLFTGLTMASGLKGVDLDAGRDESGKWYRVPTHDCPRERTLLGGTISRDMLIGMMWAAWSDGKEYLLKQLYEYGREHDWKMGDGDFDTVYFTPNMINTLRVLIGKDDDLLEMWIDPRKDHQRHVVALNILLRGEVEGNIGSGQMKVLKRFVQKQPKSALFQYAYHRFTDGDQSKALEILRRSDIFPEKRLPTSNERCGRWLWERNETSDNWLPCPEEKRTHTGGDLTFLVFLLDLSR